MARLLRHVLTLSTLCHVSVTSILPQNPLLSHPPIAASSHTPTPLPLVIWHGLGDKSVPSPTLTPPQPQRSLTSHSYAADGLQSVGALAEETNPGTYVYYIRLSDDASADRRASFLSNLTEAVSKVCSDLAAHPILSAAPAINALGFSQGGQFLRAYVERCNSPPVATLVTFGAQHNGIADFQNCALDDWVCHGARGVLRGNTWSAFVQARFVPAQYFRDPDDLDRYLESSNFLADVNNEREGKNETYRANLKRLERFAMYVFGADQTVVPKESAWFSEVNGTSGEVTGLRDRRMYAEDWLGLRWLDGEKRLEFREAPGKHMELSDELLVDAFKRYFRPRMKVGLGWR